MKCLRIDQIYSFLEKELKSEENKKIEEHLEICSKCKKVVEERTLLLQAAGSLPLWQTPADFTQQVMAKIFPAKVPLRGWLTVAATGFSTTILMLVAFFLLSGQNPSSFLTSFNHSLWNFVQNLSVIFVKFFKLVSLLVKIILQFSEHFFKGVARMTTIISPEVQIIIITFITVLAISLLYGVRRIILTGEKT